MQDWGVVNAIVPPEELIPTALKWARKICENSPDAVIVSRTGMLMSLESKFPWSLEMLFIFIWKEYR
jgi:enoyl-CoA hydratase/carnithine racemase